MNGSSLPPASAPVQHFLLNIPLLRDATADEVERMAVGTRRLKVAKGEMLFHRGDPCDGFWVVLSGQIKLSVGSEQGMEKVIEILGPGRTFGEAVMFMDMNYVVSSQALADSVVLHVLKSTVFAELERNPMFARKMLSGLSRRLHGLIRDVESYSMRSGTERVIGFLTRIDSSENDSDSNASTITLPASKVTIASRLNLTPEYFSRILHDLAAAGLIEVSGKTIRVPDLQRLRDFRA
ncbi:MAG: Crp/Fnr family transcriptional regulator [Rhodoferax sp.]